MSPSPVLCPLCVWLYDLYLVFVQSLVKVQVKWFLRQEVELFPLEVSWFLVPKTRLHCILKG